MPIERASPCHAAWTAKPGRAAAVGLDRWHGVSVLGVGTLRQMVEHVRGDVPMSQFPRPSLDGRLPAQEYPVDLADIRGQEHAKRAMEVAAAGAHNLLMSGPPGSGKTLLARALPSILPPLTPEEALETTKVHSVAGMLDSGAPLVTTRPFRAPHHTNSDAGLIGGGSTPRPGEVSLAHHGVLFMDELPEFKRNVLEVLRQPLEESEVTIVRANLSLTYPARFMLAAAMNPCPCGHHGDAQRRCTCNPVAVQRYLAQGLSELGDRLGPINWQFMPSKKFDAAEIEAFLKLLPREIGGRPLRHALEPRHARHHAQIVKLEDGLGQIEIDRTAFLPPPVEDQRQFFHQSKTRHESVIPLALLGIVFQNLVDVGVGAVDPLDQFGIVRRGGECIKDARAAPVRR